MFFFFFFVGLSQIVVFPFSYDVFLRMFFLEEKGKAENRRERNKERWRSGQTGVLRWRWRWPFKRPLSLSLSLCFLCVILQLFCYLNLNIYECEFGTFFLFLICFGIFFYLKGEIKRDKYALWIVNACYIY